MYEHGLNKALASQPSEAIAANDSLPLNKKHKRSGGVGGQGMGS
jgi:hypothetical protein